MTVYSYITMIGGLAFFLYGMHVLSGGLEKTAGGKMEHTLTNITSNKFKGLFFGAVITAVIQSSSAMTVMLVGFVNSGIMQLSQAISITMGSNIGTTITAWVLSLTGIESDNIIVNMLKPANFAPIFAFIGILLIMIGKKQKRKDIGTVLVGFALLMFGMNTMSGSVEGLTAEPEFVNILTAFSNPILGMLIGVVFTAAIQSSAASIGVLQALSMSGSITYGMAVPIVMGQNIGTCISTILASFGANKNAKRVALVHVLFNTIGAVICLAGWLVITEIFDLAFIDEPLSPVHVAVIHSIFNIITTVMLFPFSKLLEKMVCKIIKDAKETEAEVLFDDRILKVPAFAVAKANEATCDMASLAKKSIKLSMSLLSRYDEKVAEDVNEMESQLDRYEDELGSYLVKISKAQVSEDDSVQISKLLHSISDFERIGDHASNLMHTAKEMYDKKIKFSANAGEEIENLTDAITEIVSITTKAFRHDDVEMAKTVEPLEQVIDILIAEMKVRHIERLKAGECTIELGFILTDLLTNYERISDHCSNIAVAVIEAKLGEFNSHEYLGTVKREQTGTYAENYERYLKQYSI